MTCVRVCVRGSIAFLIVPSPGTLTWPEGRIYLNSKGSRFVNNGAVQMLGSHMFYRPYTYDKGGGVALAVTNSETGSMVARC